MHSDVRRLRFVLCTMSLLLLLNLGSAFYGLGWRSITVNTALILLLDCLYIWRYRDGKLGHWVLLGLVAGWVELFTDAWLVRTGTLVYPPDQPMIALSPAYMPFAWAMILTQLGTVGMWFKARHGFVAATLLTILLSGVNIPLYEHLAKDANWWSYQHTPMLFNAPYYVICAEFLLALPLVWMASGSAPPRLRQSVLLGVIEGLWMFPVTVVAFWLFGPCVGAVLQLPCPR